MTYEQRQAKIMALDILRKEVAHSPILLEAVKHYAAVLAVPVSPETDPFPDYYMPKRLDRALTVMGLAQPESAEELAISVKSYMQRLVDAVIRWENHVTPIRPITAPAFAVHSNRPCWPSVTVGLRDEEWRAAIQARGYIVEDGE